MHYIFYTDGELQGEPFTLPHRTRHGVIGANASVPVLRHMHSVIPCEYSRTLDEAEVTREMRETDGTVTYSERVVKTDDGNVQHETIEHTYPEAIATVVEYDARTAGHRQAVDTFMIEAAEICEYAGIEIPTSWDDGRSKLRKVTDKTVAYEASLELLMLRRKMDEAGVKWGELLPEPELTDEI